uniref:RNA helicase n=2 Tax=Caenorhabditis japonica TaxID=281687 RepID=A0A8R1ELX8_CAEJA
MEEYKERHENDDEQYEYDEDGNIIWTWKKVIDPLPDIDHSQIDYPKFNKNFYEEHGDIKRLHYMEVVRLQNTLNLRIGGRETPRPVCSFAHFSFDKLLMEAIRKSEYEQPTPIQAMVSF